MPTELPSTVAENFMAGLVTAANAGLNETNAVSRTAMGALQGGIVRTHNELGAEESRAVSGVLATPIASPTTQAGP